MQRGALALAGKAAAQHLRRQRGAAHSEQHDVADAVVAHAVGERAYVIELGEHALGDRQPPKTVGDLRRAGRPPQRGVGLSQPLRHARAGRGAELLGDRRCERVGDAGLEREGSVAHSTIVVAAARAADARVGFKRDCPVAQPARGPPGVSSPVARAKMSSPKNR